MATEIATAYISLVPTFRGLQGNIDRALGGVDTRRAGSSAGEGYSSGFGDAAKKITAVLSGAFAAVKVTDFAKDIVSQASDMNETATKMQVVFGQANGAVQAFASQGAKALGLSSLEAQNAAANFGVFAKAAGLAGQDQADFSTGMAKLAVDMASFSNTTPDQAIEALSAGLRGESEPLRQYGVLLDDASLRQEAMAEGITNTTKNVLTPQQRVLAAHGLILKQTSDAQGDFARTSGGLANQQRILSAQWTDMKGELGQAFLPGVTAVVSALNDHLFPTLEAARSKASAAWDVLKSGDFAGAAAGIGEEDSPLVKSLLFAHDTAVSMAPQIQAAWHSLTTGDFVSTPGVEEDSPLIKIALALRDFGLSTFDKLRGIWDTLWDTGEKLWPSIESIAESLGLVFQKIASAGILQFVSVWDLLLAAFQKVADVLNIVLVPVFDWLARFMKENPDAVMAFVVVIGAVVTAMKLWALAQWLVNAATTAWTAIMDANPFGLIVIAVAALVAAFVWAYENVDWFRNGVQVAWDIIQNVVTFAWNVIKPVFDALWGGVQQLGAVFLWLWENIIQPAWDGIQNVITFAWDNVIKPLFEAAKADIAALGAAFTFLWNYVVQPAWDGIQNAVSSAWDNVIKPVFGFISGALGSLGDAFSFLWNNMVVPAWDGIKSAVSTGWNWIRDNVFGPMGDGINTIKGFFQDLWNKAKEVWSGVSGWFGDIASAIKDAVTTVVSSIAQINNKIVDFTGVGDRMFDPGGVGGPTRGGGGGFADGGVIPGMNPGRRDNMLVPMRSGESVFVPEFTQAIGGVGTVNAWNRAAEAGRLGDLFGPGFAAGGVIGAAGPALVDKIMSKVTALLKMMSDRADAMAAAPVASAGGGAAGVPSISTSGTEQWRGTVLQALALTGEPAAYADIILNQMRTESSGNVAAINLTDINAQRGIPSKGLLQVIDPTFATYHMASLGNDIWDPLQNIVAAIRYVESAYGGIPAGMRGVAYDQGGWLQPYGSGVNLLNKPEAVLTPSESLAYQSHAKALEAGFRGEAPNVQVNCYLDGEAIDHRAEVVVDGKFVDAAYRLATAGMQG